MKGRRGPFTRPTLGRVLAGLAGLGALAATATAATGEGWIAVETEHFTVLTGGAPAPAENWARELEMFRLGLSKIMPANAAKLQPVAVVLFPNDAAFQPFKPVQNGRSAPVAGFFARADGVNAIGLSASRQAEETRRVIFHEATHWFSNALDEPLPVWLDEGTAEVYATFHVTGEREFVVGEPPPDSGRLLRAQGLPPLEALVNRPRDRLDLNGGEETARFYAEAWLFVHWLMFGEGSPGTGAILHYREELRATGDPARAFAAAFGGNYGDVQQRLEDYMASGRYIRQKFALAAGEVVRVSAARPVRPGEVEFALGALLLGAQGAPAALPYLQRAVALNPSESRRWSSLAFAQLRNHDDAGALLSLDRATAMGSPDALVWTNRAALRLESHRSGNGMGFRADGPVLGAAAADYRQALALDSLCRAAYVGLAGVAAGAVPADARDVGRLRRGRELFPHDPMIRVGYACVRLAKEPIAAERELQAVLRQKTLSPATRLIAEGALQGQRWTRLAAEIATQSAARNYAAVVQAIDAGLAAGFSEPNRRELVALRRQADQMRRIQDAVDAMNRGEIERARGLLQAVAAEGPATTEIRDETQRLWRECEARRPKARPRRR